MVGAHVIRPLLECRAVNLQGATTQAAHQVVMVLWSAAAVASLTVRWAQDINLACCGHGLKCPIHGSQPDVRACLAQSCMNLLSAAELVDGVKEILNRSSLTR